MKKLIIIALSLAFVASIHANLINLTPGGYYYPDHQNQPPGALLTLIHDEVSNRIAFFDQAQPTGWVSQFGVLNGGTYFFTDLVINGAEPFATVNWNFDALPGFGMRFVDVVGSNNGNFWEAVYLVAGSTILDSNGELLLTLNGNIDIDSVAFYGRTPTTSVPDGGSTVVLMGIGLTVITLRKRIR